MRKNLIMALLIIGTFLIQSTLRAVIPAQYTMPDLLIILTCSMGLMRGKKSGMLTGFFCGLLYDLFYGTVFGFTALCFLYIGFANGHLYKVFFDEDIRVPMATVGLSELVYKLALFILEFAVYRRYRFGTYMRGTILPAVIASILFTILMYTLYRLINKKLTEYEAEARQSPWLRR